jgi:predicted lipoprotein with Yx(FWY)xxD motif
MRKMLFLGLAAVTAASLLVAATALATESAKTSAKSAVVRISTRKLPKLGTVLVNSKGRTLYMFVPDKRKKVTCVGSCAAVWPPVKLPKGAKAVAAGKAKAALLGSDRNPPGGRVVTYNKWPLYTYVSDRAPGQAKGQALNLNGGLWYVLSPSGKVIRTK